MNINGMTKDQMKKEIIEMALAHNRKINSKVNDETVIFCTNKIIEIHEAKNELHILYNTFENTMRNK